MILAPPGALRVLKLAGLTLLAVFALGATAAQADNTYQVTRNDDPPNNGCSPGDCSLREALVDSNANPGNNTVNVPAGTYLLDGSLGNLYIGSDGSVAIKGAGARNTIIDAQHNDRVFYVSNGSASFSDLTITGGDNAGNGGGILMGKEAGDVTLTNVAVKDNRAAGGCDTVERVVCGGGSGGDGGGIYNGGYSATLTINESEISGNTAAGEDTMYGETFAAGGGIYNYGRLEARNVTINGNVAEDVETDTPKSSQRSASFYPGVGGGIFQYTNFDAESRQGGEYGANLLNLTIAGNTAGLGGGIATGYPYSGAEALQQPSEMTVKNTIVANNIATTQQAEARIGSQQDNCWDPTSAISSNGNNLVPNSSGDTSSACHLNDPSDQNGPDPALGALANNGGPTDTQAIDTGSPALDKANNSGCPGTDQRGVTRPQNVTCDIGAYEKEVVVVAPPVTPAAAVAAQAKPSASSSASGPKSCVTKTAKIRVSGKNISSVSYSLNGGKKTTKKGNKTSVTYNARGLKSGVQRVKITINYTSATGVKASTKRITFSRCARKAVQPKFTG